MPWESVQLTPGANVERTPTLNQTGYLVTKNGRFMDGLFQKLGGWRKYLPIVFAGLIKSLWAWQDLNNNKWLSVATTQGVTVTSGGVPQDITPQIFNSNFTPDFSTIIGDNTVTIVDPNISGVTTNVTVEFLTPVSVGGIILSGTYPIDLIVGGDSYTIEAQAPATATVNNGGVVPEFVTSSGSAGVTVNFPDHGLVKNQTVVFPIPTTVGGVIVQGRYTVTGVNSVNQFSIAVAQAATSSDTESMNGGLAGVNYHIALGPPASGLGYGVGPYGEGAYGKGTSTAGVQTGTPITADDWTQDNWGEILVAVPQGGAIYTWQPGTGFQNFGMIATGPLFNDGAFISMAQQQIIAWGTTVDARPGGGIGAFQDPLLLKCCDIGNFNQWEQLPENFAREFRIPTGSRIVSAMASKNRNLVWTDLDVYAMTFNGGQSVYSVNRIGSNCGLVGKHAWGQLADTVRWMGPKNFFAYAGAGVEPIPCPVWDAVFDQIDTNFLQNVECGSNTDFNEIWWWFPTRGGGGIPTKGVKYNAMSGIWDFDVPPRVAWIDRSVLGNPLGASAAGIIYSHENGFDDDLSPLQPMFQTGDFFIGEGEDFVFIDEVMPDFKWSEFGGSEQAQIRVTLLCRDNPGDAYRELGPFVVSKATPFFVPEDADGVGVRCRQVALRIDSIDVGSFWRLGRVRFRYSPDGRR